MGNPAESLLAPRFFFASMKFFRGAFSPTALDTESASGPNLAARMASRLISLELSLRLCRTQDVLIRTAPRAAACEYSVNHDGRHAADAVLLRYGRYLRVVLVVDDYFMGGTSWCF